MLMMMLMMMVISDNNDDNNYSDDDGNDDDNSDEEEEEEKDAEGISLHLIVRSTHLLSIFIQDTPQTLKACGFHHEADCLTLTNLDHSREYITVVITLSQCCYSHYL